MKRIIFIIFLVSTSALAQKKTCAPSSCSPSCGSSCSYYLCTKEASFTKLIDKLPHVLTDDSSDSCEFTTDTITKIPFEVSGTVYSKTPANVVKKYRVCQTFTKSGPACPPSDKK